MLSSASFVELTKILHFKWYHFLMVKSAVVVQSWCFFKSLQDTSLIGFQLFLIADDSSAVIRVVLNLSASVFAREIHHTLRIYVLVKMCIGIHMRNTSHTMITCSCKDVHRYSHEKMTCPVLTEAERRFFIGALRQFLGSYNHRVCFNQTIPQIIH